MLAVQDLQVSFGAAGRRATALEGISLAINRGEVLALVGESGSGKSLTALAVMGLLPPAASVDTGQIVLDGADLLRLSRDKMVHTRGRRVSMVFQEPMTSLNPVLTIGRQLTEGLEFHLGYDRHRARARAVELLGLVGITAPERRLGEYPHQFSGGMRQRVMIAMAIACEPGLIIADEPTTALDVSVQAQIIDLLLDIRERLGTALLLITHDLGVVAELADRVAVLYAGRLVEAAPAALLFDRPRHPYTKGLLDAVPRLDELAGDARPHRLTELGGSVPGLGERPPGCPFFGRCDRAVERCPGEMPPMAPTGEGGLVACWNRLP